MRSPRLEERLERIGEAAEGNVRISLGEVLETMENASFGSVLLLAGLVTLAPLVGDIPGVPTTMGVLVILTAGQLLAGRTSMWLPGWLRRRSVKTSSLGKALEWLRPVARFMDRLLRPRLEIFVRGAGTYGVAGVSLLVGAAMPLMEFIPFSANVAGVALTAFGLALAVRDGLLALIMFVMLGAAAGLLAWHLMT